MTVFERLKSLFSNNREEKIEIKKRKKKRKRDLEDIGIEEGGTHPIHEEYAKEGIVKK